METKLTVSTLSCHIYQQTIFDTGDLENDMISIAPEYHIVPENRTITENRSLSFEGKRVTAQLFSL